MSEQEYETIMTNIRNARWYNKMTFICLCIAIVCMTASLILQMAR